MTVTPLSIVRRVVRLISTLVPRWRRREWTREWEAELEADAHEGGADGSALLGRSTGAIADAMYLRSHAMYFDLWWGDLRFAWRNAVRRPGFTLLVTLTLALGLGVNGAVFALVDAVLLRPLPYRDPSRLVFVWQTLPKIGVPEVEATPFDYEAWRALKSLSSVAMLQYGSFTLTGGGGDPERIRGSRVTASLMTTLGISPITGRRFDAAEDYDDVPAVAILSDGLWRRRYGADPSIVGALIQVDDVPRTVVGIMPRGAAMPGGIGENYDLWLPMRMSPSERVSEISHSYTMLGRLADGATLQTASAEFETFAARMSAERPSHRDIGARLVPIGEYTVRAIRPALIVAAAGVALLLLVATANASTLLIARASSRGHELAVRAALGATRWRLLSLSIAETLVYSCIGGLVALVLGRWTLDGLIPLFAVFLPRSLSIDVDARTALFTAALSIAIGIVFGAIASYRPTARLADALGASTRSSASARAGRSRNVVVIAQVALAVVLLSAAGLMLTSVAKLSRVHPGFDSSHVLTFKVALTGPRYAAPGARVGFVDDLVARLRATPGTQSAAVISIVPFGGTRGANVIEIEGRPQVAGEPPVVIDQRHVSPEYFQTMRIPMVSGRGLMDTDTARSERVVVINRTMAHRFFPDSDPINRRVRSTAGIDAGNWLQIVGVVDDVRHISLSREPVPEMYHPIAQLAVPTLTVMMRTAGEPASMASAARAVVQAVDAHLPIYDVRTMDDRVASSFAQTRGTMILLMATAALAAALAGVAIYGSIWYAVVQRTPEIGIRVALGASRASLFRQIVSGAMALAGMGAVIGAGAAMAAGSLLRTLLFDTRMTDPLTYAAVMAGVFAMAIAASIVPAVRAMRVDPIAALRAN